MFGRPLADPPSDSSSNPSSSSSSDWWEDRQPQSHPYHQWRALDYQRFSFSSSASSLHYPMTTATASMPRPDLGPHRHTAPHQVTAGNIHPSSNFTTLPYPGNSSSSSATASGVPSSSSSSLGSSPGSWMAGYAAGFGMLEDGSRSALIWPPAGPLQTSNNPSSSGYSSPGSISRRARIQKVHHTTQNEQPHQHQLPLPTSSHSLPPPQQRFYHSSTYPQVQRSSSALGSASASDEEKPNLSADPEYVENDYSSGSGDPEYQEVPPSSVTSSAKQSAKRGKKRKPVDPESKQQRTAMGQAKVFQCTGFGQCNMVFSRSEHLARHIRKHTGERPFVCRCGRAFSRLDNLRQHTQTVHHDQPKKNAEMLERLAAVHANLSASASKVHKGVHITVGAANSTQGSSSSGSSSVSSEGTQGTVTRPIASQAVPQREMESEEDHPHPMVKRSATRPAPPQEYYAPSHYIHRGSMSSESTNSDFSISPSTPASRLPQLPHFASGEALANRQRLSAGTGYRYPPSLSAPPPSSADKDSYVTLPPIRSTRPQLPPLGAMLPAPHPHERGFPASYPPSTYPISPYFANASQAAWRAGLSYGAVANAYHDNIVVKTEPQSTRAGSYDYRDYIVQEEDESIVGPDPPGSAPEMRATSSEDRMSSFSADDSPPSFDGPQSTPLHQPATGEAHKPSPRSIHRAPRIRTTTVTQEEVIKAGLYELAEATASASSLNAINPFHWQAPLASGVDYFAGHSRAISAERSTATPLVPQSATMPEQVETTEKMSLRNLCDSIGAGEDAILDEKDFQMSISD